MSETNVEIAQRLYVAIASLLEKAAAGGDISDAYEYWELWDPAAVIVEIAEFPDAATYRGFEQMRRWIQGWLDAFTSFPSSLRISSRLATMSWFPSASGSARRWASKWHRT